MLVASAHANMISSYLASVPQPRSTQACTSYTGDAGLRRYKSLAQADPEARKQMLPAPRRPPERETPPPEAESATLAQLHRGLSRIQLPRYQLLETTFLDVCISVYLTRRRSRALEVQEAKHQIWAAGSLVLR